MQDVTFVDNFEVIVVGAGHAGCEAALAIKYSSKKRFGNARRNFC